MNRVITDRPQTASVSLLVLCFVLIQFSWPQLQSFAALGLFEWKKGTSCYVLSLDYQTRITHSELLRYLFSVSQKTMLGREGCPLQRIWEQGRDRDRPWTREKRWEFISAHSRVPDLNRPMKSGLIAFTTTMTTGYNSIQFHQWTKNTHRRVLSTSCSIDYEN